MPGLLSRVDAKIEHMKRALASLEEARESALLAETALAVYFVDLAIGETANNLKATPDPRTKCAGGVYPITDGVQAAMRPSERSPRVRMAPQVRACNAARDATEPLTIREVADRFGISLGALRLYEVRGLLAPARRGRTRLYGAEDLARLTQILKARALRFSLHEIEAMLVDPPRPEAVPFLTPDEVGVQIAHLEHQHRTIARALTYLRTLDMNG